MRGEDCCLLETKYGDGQPAITERVPEDLARRGTADYVGPRVAADEVMNWFGLLDAVRVAECQHQRAIRVQLRKAGRGPNSST